jgi:hypothetical protein
MRLTVAIAASTEARRDNPKDLAIINKSRLI